MDLSKKTLEKITKEKITPKPRYTFLIKNYLVWIGAGLSIFLGIQAVAIIIHLIKSQDWDIYELVNNRGEFLILSIPYFWLISLGLFIFIAYYNIKHTKSGYKYKLSTILIAYFALTLVLGTLVYFIGLGENLEDMFSKNVPIYGMISQHRNQMWQHPEEGRLVGKIIEIKNEDLLRVEDYDRYKWLVDISEIDLPDFVKFQIGMRLKIMGEIMGKNEFRAIMLRPDLPQRLLNKLPPPPPPCGGMKENNNCIRNIN